MQLLELNPLCFTLFIGSQRREKCRHVWTRGGCQRGKTHEPNGISHTLDSQQFIYHGCYRALGSLELGAGGQLHGYHQVALVQGRDKTTRHQGKLYPGQADQQQIYCPNDSPATHHHRNHAGIATGHPFETAVETVESAL